ncbi:hypothetical protein J1N35_005339 [Gossypium stocksii]|uniref:Uncharacterized protein n=1 Tax=Gossypium stocksii TaxID=47602 RepID=A0A9D4AII5_9ROSI|nr:hypothetical protein J1N35_005339 [Gossypium stocksii]
MAHSGGVEYPKALFSGPQGGSMGYSKQLYSGPKLPSSTTKSSIAGESSTVHVSSRIPIKSLSQTEMEEMRKNDLCFWYASKYTPRHTAQLYRLLIEPTANAKNNLKSLTTEEFYDCTKQLRLEESSTKPSFLVLSLHAL